MKNSLARGKMFQVYVLKLGFRLAVFLLVLWAYFKAPEYFDIIVTEKIEIDWILSGQPLTELYAYLEGINHFWVYLVWGLIMIEMVIAMLPDSKYLTMGSKKEFPDYYVPVDGYDRLELYQYVDGRMRGIEGQLAQQAVVNAQLTANLSCQQQAIATLNGLTKTVIPIASICPEVMPRYNSFVTPTTETTAAG